MALMQNRSTWPATRSSRQSPSLTFASLLQTFLPALRRLHVDLRITRSLISVRLVGACFLLFCAVGLFSSYRAAAQPVASLTGSASYVRLGGFEGPALSAGGHIAFPIGSKARGGWFVGGIWHEIAGVQTADRYERVPVFGFFSNEDCVNEETSNKASDALCEERVLLGSQSLEALYAQTGRFLSFAFGAGLRYGEEIVPGTLYDDIEERLRPYGTASLEVPVFPNASALLQMRVGEELLQVQAEAVFRFN